MGVCALFARELRGGPVKVLLVFIAFGLFSAMALQHYRESAEAAAILATDRLP